MKMWKLSMVWYRYFLESPILILGQMGCEIRYHNYEQDTGFSNCMMGDL